MYARSVAWISYSDYLSYIALCLRGFHVLGSHLNHSFDYYMSADCTDRPSISSSSTLTCASGSQGKYWEREFIDEAKEMAVASMGQRFWHELSRPYALVLGGLLGPGCRVRTWNPHTIPT